MGVKFLLTFCFLFCIYLSGKGQAKNWTNTSDTAFQKFHVSLSRNFKFPAAARRMGKEGTALFKFELSNNGSCKSIVAENDLGKQFIWYFKDAISKVPNKLLVHLMKETKDSIFILPVALNMGSSLDNYDSSEYTLRRLVVRTMGFQRTRIRTTHGDMVTPGTEGTYYDLSEADKNPSSVLGISLVRKDLKEFPKQVQGMTNIKYIDFESNSLKELPPFIGELQSLEELYLFKNIIESLPKSLSKLKSIHNLVLSHNKLNSFPEAILGLTNLEVLDLSNNDIHIIPSQIDLLTKLRFLYLENNNIKNVPIDLFNLTNLEKVYLQGNPLTMKDITALQERFKTVEFVW